MSQTKTGQLTERRVRERLEANGLMAMKPVPDRGIDLVASKPDRPSIQARIQVKGRNPKQVPTLRWFQIRVTPRDLERGLAQRWPADRTWQVKVEKADFFILDAVKVDEMWVLNMSQVFDLIAMNARVYGSRPDNIFNYDRPFRQKQKEMNLDIQIDGRPLTDQFRGCLNNFTPIINFLERDR